MTPRALRVLHVCTPAAVGGLERVVQGVTMGLARAGHDVTLVSIVDPGHDLEEFVSPMEGAGVACHRLDVASRDYLRERREVQALLDRLRPQVVHTHGYRADLLHGRAARRAGAASVSTLHGSSRMGGVSHLFEWLQERALRSFDGVIAVSRPLADRLRRVGVPPAHLHVLANAVAEGAQPLERKAARERLGVPDDACVIGWVGRFIPIKGGDVFVRAFAQSRHEAAIAVMIGDGPERDACRALAQEHGIADRLILPGAIPQAGAMMAAFDVFVLSSHSEGTPMVVLEAMGAGVPVIATDVGGVADLMAGVDRALLVPAGAEGALAKALDHCLADRPGRLLLGRALAERATSHYGYTQWITGHEHVYREALRLAGVRRGTP